MQFSKLLRGEDVGQVTGRLDREAVALTCDSRTAERGSVFFCFRGARHDGHDFAQEAYRRGCRIFVAERPLVLPADTTVLLTPNAERRMALFASDFYGAPAKDMTVIGITGTKGKTTTAQMLCRFLTAVGRQCACIGSSGAFIGEKRYETENTTPQSLTLFHYIAKARDAGIRTLVLEVSSQALSRGRLHGLPIDVGVFTNLSRDHIGVGEHSDMQDYAAAKLSLFTNHGVQTAILNASDPFSSVIAREARPQTVIHFGNGAGSCFRYRDLCPLRVAGGLGSHALLLCDGVEHEVTIPLAGAHYVEDLLGALATAQHLTGADIGRLLEHARGLTVAGRCETVTMANGAVFVIDYAHNGASLRAALTGLRPHATGRLMCLFGAVGERTQCRRRDMALAACRLADLLVITEDNSGGEDPAGIIGEIYRALPDRRCAICIPDRREAIRYLAGIAMAGDVVLLAGKGDEEYQLSRDARLPFSEKDILTECANIQGKK